MKKATFRQQEIINAALEIVAEKGIQSLTTKNLALAVGVSEPALYRHFSSKFSILMSILEQFKREFIGLLEEQMSTGNPPVDKIVSFYSGLFRLFTEKPALSAVIFSEDLFRYDKRLSREVFSIIEMTHDRVYRILSRGKQNGEVRPDIPTKQLAWIVMGAMRLLITKWRISGYTIDLVREGNTLYKYIRLLLSH